MRALISTGGSTRKLTMYAAPSILLLMKYSRIRPYLVIIGWVALLASFWTTADLVADLVFEDSALVVDLHAAGEDPDNAAEHVLIPSLREAPSTANTVMAATGGDLSAVSFGGPGPARTALIAASSHYPPPRSSPVSFSIPLRI